MWIKRLSIRSDFWTYCIPCRCSELSQGQWKLEMVSPESASKIDAAWQINMMSWMRCKDWTSTRFFFSNKLRLYSSKWLSIRFGCPSGQGWQQCVLWLLCTNQARPKTGMRSCLWERSITQRGLIIRLLILSNKAKAPSLTFTASCLSQCSLQHVPCVPA